MKRWPTKLLGELVAIEKGKKSSEVFPAPTRSSIRYLQIEDLRPNANIKYCEPFNCPTATKADVIIAWDGANAGTVSCNLSGHIGSTLAVLRPIESNTLSPVFLSRFLQGNFHYLQRTATGATVPHISKDALNCLQIPVPPLVEQERLVKLLNEADELRKLRTQADSRTADLIPALFHEMFGDHSGNPMGWEIKELKSVCIIGDGNHSSNYPKASEMLPIGIPFIRAANLQGGRIDDTDMRYINIEKHQKLKKGHLKTGDVLFSNRGEIGKLAIVPKEFNNSNLNSQLAWLRPKEMLLPEYLFSLLASDFYQTEFGRAQQGVALQQFTIRQLSNVQVLLPPLPLQKEFAARVAEIRAMEAQQAASRPRLESLFQSMLHRAFTGDL
jgi:type I restriction enzyme S subunit